MAVGQSELCAPGSSAGRVTASCSLEALWLLQASSLQWDMGPCVPATCRGAELGTYPCPRSHPGKAPAETRAACKATWLRECWEAGRRGRRAGGLRGGDCVCARRVRDVTCQQLEQT